MKCEVASLNFEVEQVAKGSRTDLANAASHFEEHRSSDNGLRRLLVLGLYIVSLNIIPSLGCIRVEVGTHGYEARDELLKAWVGRSLTGLGRLLLRCRGRRIR